QGHGRFARGNSIRAAASRAAQRAPGVSDDCGQVAFARIREFNMGKVYEALKRSGACIDDEAVHGSRAPIVGEDGGQIAPEPTNYLDYLLNGIPAAETTAPATAGQLAPSARAVIDLARPAMIDAGRIDQRLV